MLLHGPRPVPGPQWAAITRTVPADLLVYTRHADVRPLGPLGARMKIVFLLYNAYGIGGTIRSTVNLSAALAPRHDVRIVSVHRTVDAPQLAVDPRVTLTSLIDWRPGSGDTAAEDPAAGRPSWMFTDEGVCKDRLTPSRLTDRRVAAFLRGTGADVLIATRPVPVGQLAR